MLVNRWSYSRTSAVAACAADTQWIVPFTLRPSGALPPRVAGSYVQRSSTTSPAVVLDHAGARDEVRHRVAALRGRGRAGRTSSAGLPGSRRARCTARARTGTLRVPSSGLRGLFGTRAVLDLALRIVLDHDLQRAQHGHHARRALVQVLAHAVLEQGDVDQRCRASPRRCARRSRGSPRACSRGGAARRSSACADRPSRRRCPPATSCEQLALAHHRVGQVRAARTRSAAGGARKPCSLRRRTSRTAAGGPRTPACRSNA